MTSLRDPDSCRGEIDMFDKELGKNTDFQKFDEFFKLLGVTVRYSANTHDYRHGDEPKSSVYRLSVSQAIFCFDKKGRYLGAVADELGNFERRV